MFPHVPTYEADNGREQVLSLLNQPLKSQLTPTLTRAQQFIQDNTLAPFRHCLSMVLVENTVENANKANSYQFFEVHGHNCTPARTLTLKRPLKRPPV